ncbi:MAG TPA: hypothetical protein VFY71_17645 [Planctomycetota bacterium]|nr:hypothetical protein [Planctomycetota bacterium]
MVRALLLLTLLLTVGEVTGLLDAALHQDCATCATTGDDGCMLCPCCSQGRLACTADAPSLPAPTVVERIAFRELCPAPEAVGTRIFHPPRAIQG